MNRIWLTQQTRGQHSTKTTIKGRLFPLVGCWDYDIAECSFQGLQWSSAPRVAPGLRAWTGCADCPPLPLKRPMLGLPFCCQLTGSKTSEQLI